jgi:integrase
MASLWKQNGSPHWYVRFVDPLTGRNVRKSTGTTDRKTAELILKEIEVKIAKGQYGFEELMPKVYMLQFASEYIENYSKVNKAESTCRIDTLALKRWLEFVGDIPLVNVSVKKIELFKRERQNYVKPVSLNIELRSLKAAFQVAVKWGYLKSNPFKDVKQLRVPETSAPRRLSDAEISRLLDVVDDEKIRLLFELYLNTGGRRNEVLSLQWDNIDFENQTVTFANGTKFGKKRVIPLNSRALEIFTYLRNSGHNNSSRIFNYEKDYISRRFKYYARKAGLPESIRTHSLRHTFASILSENSIDIHTIKELMGHSSIKVTEIYSHLSPEHKIKAVKRLKY